MWTSVGLQETFAFFEDPYNLAKITPPRLSFQVTSEQKVEMHRGAEIRYTIRWLGLPMRWKTLIREYEPPNFFSDEQASGPYRLWLYQHTFKAVNGGTMVGDLVRYQLPLGPLGRLAHFLGVKRQLLSIFKYRQRRIGEVLGGQTTQVVEPRVQLQ